MFLGYFNTLGHENIYNSNEVQKMQLENSTIQENNVNSINPFQSGNNTT